MLIVIDEEKKTVSVKRYIPLKVGRIKSLLNITHRGRGRGEEERGDRDLPSSASAS